MLFAMVGDIHGDINGMYAYLKRWEKHSQSKIDAVIQVGDWGTYYLDKRIMSDWRQYWNRQREAPYPTWVAMGNHEGWPEIAAWMAEPDRVPNIHLLPDGQITDVLGVKVGTVWGNFSPNSWHNPAIIDQVRKWDMNSLKTMHIYRPSVERLQALGAFDILVTHDAPYGYMNGKQPPLSIKKQLGLADDEIATGCMGFNELWKTSKCHSHFFGHFHYLRVCRDSDPLVVGLHCMQYNIEDSFWFLEV